VIDALDNKMIFASLANLRLAPHVREGRALAPVPGFEAQLAARRARPEAATGSGAGTKIPVDCEKVSLSAEARLAFERAMATSATGTNVDPSPIPTTASGYESIAAPHALPVEQAAATTGPAPALAAALAAAAYRASDAPAASPTTSSATSLLGTLRA
jgi:hypothetical protein